MAAGHGYNPAAAGVPRPDAQDFVPGSSYYNMASAQMQDGVFGYVDPNALNAHPSVSCAPPAAMMLAPPTQPFLHREVPYAPEAMANTHDKRRVDHEHGLTSAAGSDVDGRVAAQPPPPPTLDNVDGLRCPSPSLHQVRSDVEAVQDRLVRIGKRVDYIESRHNELVAFCESFSSWSRNVLTYYEKLNRKIDAVEEKSQQTTCFDGERLTS